MRFLRRRQSWLLRWALAAMMEVSVLMPLPLVLLTLGGDRAMLAAVPGYGPFLAAYAAAGLLEAASHRATDRAAIARRIAGAAFGTLVAYFWTYAFLPEGLSPGGPWELNPAMAVLPFAWIAWGWGSDAVAKGLDYYSLFDRFKARAILLVAAIVMLLVAGVAGTGAVDLLLYWNVVLFFAAGLTALFLSRQHLLRTELQHLGEEGPGATDQPVITWIVICLLGLSLLAAHLLSVHTLASVARDAFSLVRPLLDWAWDVLFLLITPYLQILFLVMNGIFTLIKRLPVQPKKEMEMGEGGQEPLELPESDPVAEAAGYPWFRLVMTAVAVVALIWWMLKIRRARLKAEGDDPDEVRESLGFWSQLLGDLASLLALVRGRLVPRPAQEGPALAADELPPVLDPRILFRRLQRWGRTMGRARGPSETPEQYRRALSGQAPDAAGHVSVVSDLYQRARYGPREPIEQDVKQGADAVEALEQSTKQEPGAGSDKRG